MGVQIVQINRIDDNGSGSRSIPDLIVAIRTRQLERSAVCFADSGQDDPAIGVGRKTGGQSDMSGVALFICQDLDVKLELLR